MKKIFFALCVIGMSSCEKDIVNNTDLNDCNCGIITKSKVINSNKQRIWVENNCSGYDRYFDIIGYTNESSVCLRTLDLVIWPANNGANNYVGPAAYGSGIGYEGDW